MTWLILFVFGIAIGSFLNVVAMRYDGEHFLLSNRVIGGRSHCPHCKKTLRWFELVPLASFIMLGGRCARCKAPLSWQYPIVEFISGFVFALVPYRVEIFTGATGPAFFGLAAFWVVAFEALLVMSLIDIRLGIIPDEINIFLLALGILLAIFTAGYFGAGTNPSLVGFYANLFGLQQNLWLSRLAGAAFGGAFFAFLIFITRGKGMGLGDLKLAIPLGLFFGWPDILLVVAFGTLVGAVVGLAAIALGRKTMKGTLPFGPFLAAGAAITFFFAYPLLQWYFSFLGLR